MLKQEKHSLLKHKKAPQAQPWKKFGRRRRPLKAGAASAATNPSALNSDYASQPISKADDAKNPCLNVFYSRKNSKVKPTTSCASYI